MSDLDRVAEVYDEWVASKDTGVVAADDPEGHWLDDDEFWQRARDGGLLQEAEFVAGKHPRDRVGRFRDVPEFMRSIIPNAHVVGGAVRDKLLGKPPKDHDFLAPGMDHGEVRRTLEPHGRVEDLVVDGREVGVRFWPHDRSVPWPREGIEVTPPRTEISTGPGRHDFEIVADRTVPVERDMERRDFTVNAIAEAPGASFARVERTGVPEIDSAIDAYRKKGKVNDPEYPGDPLTLTVLKHPDEAEGFCSTVSKDFAEFARGRGLDAYDSGENVHVEGDYPHPNNPLLATDHSADAFGYTDRTRKSNYDEHSATVIEHEGRSFVVDWAAAQYGYSEFPMVMEVKPTLIDPLGGAQDAKDKVLRVVGETAFRDDGLRLARGLRFISQHDLTPDPATLDQMTTWSRRIRSVAGERIRDEFHKLLMGDNPAKALRVARDTGVLAQMFPEWTATIGFEQQSKYHGLTADEHIFGVVQAAADAKAPLPVRIAAFWHDAGKPASGWLGEDGKLHYYENPELGKLAHEDISRDLFNQAAGQGRLAYPDQLRQQVAHIIGHHMFQDHGNPSPVRARKFLAKHGPELAGMLIEHKRADIRGKQEDSDEKLKGQVETVDAFAKQIEAQAGAAVSVRDLEINGRDLIDLGFPSGPEIGGTLDALLAQVLGTPSLNNREWLTKTAAHMLKKGPPIRTTKKDEQGTLLNRSLYTEMFPEQQDVDAARRDTVDFLRMVAAMRRRSLGGRSSVYAGGEDVVLNHGKFFRKKPEIPQRDFPPEICIPGQCFSNALMTAMRGSWSEDYAKGLTYTEGWAMPDGLIPVHHAWLVDEDGNVFDPTWDFHREAVYVGVPFATSFVAKEAARRGTDTIFDYEFPYDHPVTPEMIVDLPGEPVAEWVARHAGSLRDFDAELGSLNL